MKKSSTNKKRLSNIYVIIIYFIAAITSLNLSDDSLITHILGILFIIAGTYGVVAVSKNKRFLF